MKQNIRKLIMDFSNEIEEENMFRTSSSKDYSQMREVAENFLIFCNQKGYF